MILSFIKIANKYLQNFKPLLKNDLNNESRVQMSFNMKIVKYH